MHTEIDQDRGLLYRAGGISAVSLGIAYIAIIALYVRTGVPPGAIDARLEYLSGNTRAWWTILGLSVLTDFLFMPLSLALYFALKEVSRTVMLFATVCVALFVVLDLAITWTNYASLITLSGQYAQSVTEAQKAAVITAATYPSVVLRSGLLFVFNTLVLAVGILLIGIVMLKGGFGKSVAYLGLATGILGIVSVVGPFFVEALSATIIFTSILTTIWVFFVGSRLYKLARQY